MTGTNLAFMVQHVLALYLTRLDGRTRLGLLDQRPTGDLLGQTLNHLMALFKDYPTLQRLRGITRDAFGMYFVIDPTFVGQLRVRMAFRPPVDSSEEQGWDEKSRKFHGTAIPVEQLSDGVKAFTGLVAAVLSVDYKVMLIDEPEAFLHPPLASRLGRLLAQLAAERHGAVLASTHSSDFVMGAIESGVKVKHRQVDI